MRVLPLVIAHSFCLDAFAVEVAQSRAVGDLQTRLAGQLLDIVPVSFRGVAFA